MFEIHARFDVVFGPVFGRFWVPTWGHFGSQVGTNLGKIGFFIFFVFLMISGPSWGRFWDRFWEVLGVDFGRFLGGFKMEIHDCFYVCIIGYRGVIFLIC